MRKGILDYIAELPPEGKETWEQLLDDLVARLQRDVPALQGTPAPVLKEDILRLIDKGYIGLELEEGHYRWAVTPQARKAIQQG